MATKSIEVEEFVDLAEIDSTFFETSYYVAPAAGAKPYALLAQALQRSGKVAIVRFVTCGRQHTAALRSTHGRLVTSILAYADELVPVEEMDELAGLRDVGVSDGEATMAKMLVDSLKTPITPGGRVRDRRESDTEQRSPLFGSGLR